MATTVRPLTAPTILITGTQVNDDGTTTARVNYDVGTTYSGEPTDLTHTKKAPMLFRGPVTVTLSTSYPKSSRAVRASSKNQPMDLVHVGKFSDAENGKKAEIVYTLNGKNPTRTHARWYSGSFQLGMNKSGGDNTVLKTRLYYRGEASPVTQVEIRIQETDRTENNSVGN